MANPFLDLLEKFAPIVEDKEPKQETANTESVPQAPIAPKEEPPTAIEQSRAPAGGVTADMIQSAIANIPPVNRRPTVSLIPEESPKAVEARIDREKQIHTSLEKLREDYKKAQDDARSRQMKAEMFAAVGNNIGNIVGGAQAMNTKAAVTPTKMHKIEVGDLLAQVDSGHKIDTESLLSEFKRLREGYLSPKEISRLKLQEAFLNKGYDQMNQSATHFNYNLLKREEEEQIRKEEKKLQKATALSDKVFKSGLHNLSGTIEQIEQKLGMSIEDALKKRLDVPGYGRGGSIVPNIFAGDDARDFRQWIQGLGNIQISKQYGASQTGPEIARFSKEFGDGTFESDRTLLQGLANIKRKYNEDLNAIYNGFPEDIVQKYAEESGIQVKPPSSNTIRVQGPSGEIATLPADKAEKYLSRKGYKRVD